MTMISQIIIYFCIGLLAGFMSGMFGIYLNKIAPDFSRKINPNPWNILIGTLFLNLITGMRGGSGGSLFPPFLRAMKLLGKF